MCIDVYFDAEQQERTREPPFKQKCVLTTVTKEAGNQFFFFFIKQYLVGMFILCY